jgi:hypothetical protein
VHHAFDEVFDAKKKRTPFVVSALNSTHRGQKSPPSSTS